MNSMTLLNNTCDKKDNLGKSTGKIIRLLLSFTALLLFGYFIYRVGLNNLRQQINKADLFMIFLAVGSYCVSNAVRALRFRCLLLPKQVLFIPIFHLTNLYNFITAMFPMGTGEFSYPILLKQKFGEEFGKGLHAVIITRLFDILIILPCCIITCLIFFGSVPILIPLFMFLFFLIIIFCYLINRRYSQKIRSFLETVVKKTNSRIINKLLNILITMYSEYEKLFTGYLPLKVLIYSVGQWFFVFLFFWFILQAVGLEISLLQSVYIGTSMTLFSFLPVNALGGIGFRDAALTWLLTMIGFSGKEALSSSILIRVISLATLAGLPVLTLQNAQARVQVSPRIITVA